MKSYPEQDVGNVQAHRHVPATHCILLAQIMLSALPHEAPSVHLPQCVSVRRAAAPAQGINITLTEALVLACAGCTFSQVAFTWI